MKPVFYNEMIINDNHSAQKNKPASRRKIYTFLICDNYYIGSKNCNVYEQN